MAYWVSAKTFCATSTSAAYRVVGTGSPATFQGAAPSQHFARTWRFFGKCGRPDRRSLGPLAAGSKVNMHEIRARFEAEAQKAYLPWSCLEGNGIAVRQAKSGAVLSMCFERVALPTTPMCGGLRWAERSINRLPSLSRADGLFSSLPVPDGRNAALRHARTALLAIVSAGLCANFQLHQPFGCRADHLAQKVGIGALLYKRTEVHHWLGHRGHPSVQVGSATRPDRETRLPPTATPRHGTSQMGARQTLKSVESQLLSGSITYR